VTGADDGPDGRRRRRSGRPLGGPPGRRGRVNVWSGWGGPGRQPEVGEEARTTAGSWTVAMTRSRSTPPRSRRAGGRRGTGWPPACGRCRQGPGGRSGPLGSVSAPAGRGRRDTGASSPRGMRAASFSKNSMGSKRKCDVPSHHTVLSSSRTRPSARRRTRSLASAGRRRYRQSCSNRVKRPPSRVFRT
jgi:hypothetical protein